jgi:MraZ protein
VSTRFIGRYEHSLDGKGRLILPARFRLSFDSVAIVSKEKDRCLAIWTPDEFDKKAEKMAPLMDGNQQQRAEARAFWMGSAEVDIDKQGRLALPTYLREFAGMEEGASVLVHGAHNHIELWSPHLWEAHGSLGDAYLGGDLPPSGREEPPGEGA